MKVPKINFLKKKQKEKLKANWSNRAYRQR